jgi:hypothetical protein
VSGETELYAFQVKLADGRVFTEGDGVTWDSVPTDSPVQALSLLEKASGVSIFTIEGGVKYYFANEAVAMVGGEGVFAGKLFGVLLGHEAREIKVDLLDGAARFYERRLPAADLLYAEHAYRKGTSNMVVELGG